jgi:hypothetical protein
MRWTRIHQVQPEWGYASETIIIPHPTSTNKHDHDRDENMDNALETLMQLMNACHEDVAHDEEWAMVQPSLMISSVPLSSHCSSSLNPCRKINFLHRDHLRRPRSDPNHPTSTHHSSHQINQINLGKDIPAFNQTRCNTPLSQSSPYFPPSTNRPAM